MHPQHFGRLLLVILPGTMILTYLLKLTSSDMLRRDAIAELYHSTDEIAAQAPTVVHHYITGGPAASSCSEAERAALFRAGAKLGGANWLLRSGWGEAADCCAWKGVGCVRRGVDSLSLSKEGLQGTLPSQLGVLSNLQSFDVNGNGQLSGTLPSQLIAAARLTHLYAFGARISGTLPAAALGAAHVLQELELSNCRLSGSLPPDGLPASLRFVFLESNHLSGSIPSSLGKLRRLRELELSHNKFSGSLPARVAHMNLDHLDVAKNTRLTGVPKQVPKQGCSGGAEKYLRGQQPGVAAGVQQQQQAQAQAQARQAQGYSQVTKADFSAGSAAPLGVV